jgi:succinoglycan biosynthesis protein ExoA
MPDPKPAVSRPGPKTSAPVISVCIVTARRPVLLDACLSSLQAQANPPSFEVLVCCNGDPGAADAVLARFPDAHVGVTASTAPGAARNFLVARAGGELLLFLDDDVVAHRSLLRHLADLATAWPQVMVFGGPNETPPGSSRFQAVQGAVLASLLGSGPVRRRYGRHRAGPADERSFTLCNLALRREVMLPFPPDLVCAEENVVLSELSRRGVAMRYDPVLVVFHERRPTVRAFLSQVFGYGRGRGALLVRSPGTFRPAYAVPVALLAYLVALPALVRQGGSAWLLPVAAYSVVLITAGGRVAWTFRRPRVGPTAAALVGGLHVWYGAGIVTGLAAGITSVATRTMAPTRPRERRLVAFRWLGEDALRDLPAPSRQGSSDGA